MNSVANLKQDEQEYSEYISKIYDLFFVINKSEDFLDEPEYVSITNRETIYQEVMHLFDTYGYYQNVDADRIYVQERLDNFMLSCNIKSVALQDCAGAQLAQGKVRAHMFDTSLGM